MARSLQEARTCLAESKPDLVIADLVLPDGQGTELLPDINEERLFPLVVMASHGDEQIAVEAMKAGALDYVVKSPTTLTNMPHIAERALREWGHIIERKWAEEVSRKTRDEFWELYNNAPVGYHQIDIEGRIVMVNQTEATLLGYTRDEMLGYPVFNFIAEAERDTAREEIRKKIAREQPIASFERTYVRKDGRKIPVAIEEQLVFDEQGEVIGIRSTLQDITERKRAEEQIKASLKEKEILLKEIHHRVKNNMQVIISLLRLQGRYIKDEKYVEIFRECQNRIKSMVLVHEKLYKSENLASIDFGRYIKDLASTLFRTYKFTSKIALLIDVEDVSLSIDSAIPCGLIINELVSNSLKYAFPESKEGEIKITLRSTNENEVELIVSDNGVGIPENVDFRNTKSLGLQLVTTLAEDQLESNIELSRTEGTEFRIKFKG